MKNISLSLLILTITFFSFGQQEGHFINMINNAYMINPAAAGLTSVMQFEATSRAQWTGYNGGPRTMYFSGHSQIKTKKTTKVLHEFNVDNRPLFMSPAYTTGSTKHIVGGSAMNESIGPFQRTNILGSYAIHMPLTKKINFGAGLGLGWGNFKIIQDRVQLYQTDDPAYDQFLGNTSAQNIVNANAGLVFYNSKFFVGVSSQQLLNNPVVFEDVQTKSKFNRHFYFSANYGWDASESFEIRPTLVTKVSQHTPWSMDIGAKFTYNRAFWTAIQYRTSNAVTIQLGANIFKNIYLAYGYEHGTGALKTANNGTHEFQIGLFIGNNRNIERELKENQSENAE